MDAELLLERQSLLLACGELRPHRTEATIRSLSPDDVEVLNHHWPAWSRPKQRPPTRDWTVWLVLAGRGFGKTRTGAEQVRLWAESDEISYITLAGATEDDVRDAMVEGESGVLACSRPGFRPKYEPSKRRLTWPNGCRALLMSADEPDRFRGQQHEKAWADELAAWRRPEAWDMLLMGLRIGRQPQVIATTTPRPTLLIRQLVADPTTCTTRGSTWENRDHLAAPFLSQIARQYEGTRLGRQELEAEILDDTPGALWTLGLLDRCRIAAPPELRRTVVGIDPSVASDGGGDECGIVVAAVGLCDCLVRAGQAAAPELHGFVLDDLSGSLAPERWASRAIAAYRAQEADRIVAETNNGGGLVEATLRAVDRTVAYKAVHASQGKRARAEPIAALYEQGRIHHVGPMPKLEDELRSWSPLDGGASPNRLDALVWALTELMLGPRTATPSYDRTRFTFRTQF